MSQSKSRGTQSVKAELESLRRSVEAIARKGMEEERTYEVLLVHAWDATVPPEKRVIKAEGYTWDPQFVGFHVDGERSAIVIPTGRISEIHCVDAPEWRARAIARNVMAGIEEPAATSADAAE